MKIISLPTKLTYEYEPKKSGENNGVCPECEQNRRHKGKKSFSWNNQKKTGFCHNCQASFVEFKPFKEQKQYFIPEWKNITEVSDRALKYFEGRMISQQTIKKLRIYSSTEFMPQTGKTESVICFPYFLDNRLVNVKFRDGAKHFKLVKDAELILYNINALIGVKDIVITEGEFDCAAYIEAGIDNCISVPNGASARNLEYLDNYIELFDTIEKIYLATDNDIAGIELREELIRRFGPEKCSVVSFRDCKDANEYLVKYGGQALCETIKTASDVPVEGIINLGSIYDDIYSMFMKGIEPGKSINIPELDKLLTWELGRLAIVTGIPGHGKSEFVDFIVVLLNIIHGWKSAYFSPENYPIKYHYSKLAEKISGKKFKNGYMDSETFANVFDYVCDNFHFIYPEDDMTFENIIQKAKYLVKKCGIKILVIDPYNKLDHLRERGESETDYISKFLDRITTFAKRNNVLVFLVAHPRKMEKLASGIFAIPTLYDINGSANFYNKCDYGISVYRNNAANTVSIDVLKVKFKHLGSGGTLDMMYNYNNGRYEITGKTIDSWDNSNYLSPKVETAEQKMPVNNEFDNTANWSEIPPF